MQSSSNLWLKRTRRPLQREVAEEELEHEHVSREGEEVRQAVVENCV